MPISNNDSFHSTPSLVPGHLPKNEKILKKIGHYQILKEIGKGGMGEVFLAYDTFCGRRVALKTIKSDLIDHKLIQQRFLKEARITSQLTHPAIVPVYSLHIEKEIIYYTMPYIEGKTLKQILREAKQEDKSGEKIHHLGSSIPALIRIFLSVSQAVAYAHSKGVLHRDIKPENIIIGPFGEVLILDWGLAKLCNDSEEEEEIPIAEKGPMTRAGKIVGTVNYMAPERALGKPASEQTEVYALGVTLYQLLTLKMPFQRPSLETFKKIIDKEELQNPAEMAPYRDVPRLLGQICQKCLSREAADRYSSVAKLNQEIENYLEGAAEWFEVASLLIEKREHWEFQENVLIAEHTAITSRPSVSEWVNLMISSAPFAENCKISTRLKLGEKSLGIGFLLSVPEKEDRLHLNEGYSLWIGSDLNPSTRLTRATVEVVNAPEVSLARERWYTIEIEKIGHSLYLLLNGERCLTYISHLPTKGTHIGVISRDHDFILDPIKVSVGSLSATVSCLSVPDAFLANKFYHIALTEYRRISASFPGRTEGRDAIFRAGITLLEEGKEAHAEEEKDALFEEALKEFELLHKTPGAPLEYLGKALVYEAWNDFDEETKCYELAFRRFPTHPLISILREHLVYRMHVSSRVDRKATYKFILTAIRHLPEGSSSAFTQTLFSHLQSHMEKIPFLIPQKENETTFLPLLLAFWLDEPNTLLELFQKNESEEMQENIIRALIALKHIEEAESLISSHASPLIKKLMRYIKDGAEINFPKKMTPNDLATCLLIAYYGLQKGDFTLVHRSAEILEDRKYLTYAIKALIATVYLIENDMTRLGALIESAPIEALTSEHSPLFPIYGCWLLMTEGKAIAKIHFSSVIEQPYPPSTSLLAHYLKDRNNFLEHWKKRAFQWEIDAFEQQKALYDALCI